MIRTLKTYAIYDPATRDILSLCARRKDADKEAKRYSGTAVHGRKCIVVPLKGMYAWSSTRND